MRLASVFALAFAALILMSTPAFAHATLVKADPGQGSTATEPPKSITLEFNEAVELRFGGVRVFDSKLKRVETGEPEKVSDRVVRVSLADLPDGTYSVAWKVISADSHPVQGAFTFAVGAVGDTPRADLGAALDEFGSVGLPVQVAAGVARFFGYLTSLILLGSTLFLLVAWRPQPPGGDADRAFLSRTARLLRRTWPIALVADLLLLTTQAANESAGSIVDVFVPSQLGPVIGSNFGRFWIVRTVLLLVALVLIRRAIALDGSVWRPGLTKVLALAAAGVMITPAFWGHANTLSPRALGIASDALHALTVATWIGGLLVLLFVVPKALAAASAEESAASMAATVPRFSVTALLSVGLLTATGTYLAVMHVKSWGALFGSGYGRLVLAKIAGLAVALLLASYNLFKTRKGLAASAADPAASQRWSEILRKAVRGEVLVTMVVIALAAALVSVPPANSGTFAPEVFEASADLNGAFVTATLAPARVGKSSAHFYILNPDGSPDGSVVDPKLILTEVDQNLGPFEYRGLILAPGHFVVTGIDLPAAGTWKMYMIVTRGKFDSLDHTFEFKVG